VVPQFDLIIGWQGRPRGQQQQPPGDYGDHQGIHDRLPGDPTQRRHPSRRLRESFQRWSETTGAGACFNDGVINRRERVALPSDRLGKGLARGSLFGQSRGKPTGWPVEFIGHLPQPNLQGQAAAHKRRYLAVERREVFKRDALGFTARR
jgi:hypothetical protein